MSMLHSSKKFHPIAKHTLDWGRINYKRIKTEIANKILTALNESLVEILQPTMTGKAQGVSESLCTKKHHRNQNVHFA